MLKELLEVVFAKYLVAEGKPDHALSPTLSLTSDASMSEDESESSGVVDEEDVINKEIKPKCRHQMSDLTMNDSQETLEHSPSKVNALEVTAGENPNLVTLSWPGALLVEQIQSASSPALSWPETAKRNAAQQEKEDCIRQLHLRDQYRKEQILRKMMAQQEEEKLRSKEQMQDFMKKHLVLGGESERACPPESMEERDEPEIDRHLQQSTSEPSKKEDKGSTLVKKLHKIMHLRGKKKRRESSKMKLGASASRKVILGQ